MKKITTIYKKTSHWLFRDNLELGKYWWHRLIKVIFLSLFFLIAIGSYIALITDPDTELLSKNNISVKNTLYQFTENYKGEDYNNTIPKFFEQKGNFGVLKGNKIEYVSSYSLGKSFCIKAPEKYQDNIIKVLYEDYKSKLSYEKTPESLEGFSNAIKNNIFEDTTRKCFLYDISTYNEELKNIENLSSNIINYRPNIIFYIEATIVVLLIALLSFVLFALIYYRLILYIVYGNKK